MRLITNLRVRFSMRFVREVGGFLTQPRSRSTGFWLHCAILMRWPTGGIFMPIIKTLSQSAGSDPNWQRTRLGAFLVRVLCDWYHPILVCYLRCTYIMEIYRYCLSPAAHPLLFIPCCLSPTVYPLLSLSYLDLAVGPLWRCFAFSKSCCMIA